MQTAAAGEMYIDPDIPLETDQMIEVIIDFNQEPVHSESDEIHSTETESPEAVDEAFLKLLQDENIKVQGLEKLENVFYGYTMVIKASDIEQLTSFNDIKAIYKSQIYEVKQTDEDETEEDVISLLHEGSTSLTGKGIKIAVLDSGIDYHHPDLKHAFRGGSNFIRDGRTDVLEGHGVNSSHGTSVSSVIAGNGKLNGIAPDVDLYVYRVLGEDGRGPTGVILSAMEQAMKDKVDVVNLSFGQVSNKADTPLTKAINHMVEAGIVVVASAGNEGVDGEGTITSPGTSPLAVTVGSSATVRGAHIVTEFSSQGPLTDTLDIKPDLTAPGRSIYTAISKSKAKGNYEKAYDTVSGTSFSAPYIAGLAALLLEQNSELTPSEVKLRLMNNTTKISGYSVNETGAGNVDPKAVLQATETAWFLDHHTYQEGGDTSSIDHWNGSLNMRSLPAGASFTRDYTLYVENKSSEMKEYLTNVESNHDSHASLELPESITVPAGETVPVTVTLTADGKQKAGYLDGWIVLEESSGKKLRLPYGGAIEEMASPITSFDTNRSIVGGAYLPSFTWELSEEAAVSIHLLNESGKNLGKIEPAATNDLTWDLQYMTMQDEKKTAEAGVYTIQLSAATTRGTFTSSFELEIYHTAPVINIKEQVIKGNLIQGTIASRFAETNAGGKSLTLSYTLSQEEEIYASGTAKVESDGIFSIREELKSGESTLQLEAKDSIGNTSTKSIIVEKADQTLRLHDEGNHVQLLQEYLVTLGFYSGEQTGVFNDGTEAAVIELQAYYGFPESGEVDTELLEFMQSVIDGKYANTADSEEVRAFKIRLTHLGFGNFPERPSSRFGPVTASVVKDFQQHYGLITNGIGDPVTLEKMSEVWSRAFKNGDVSDGVRELKQQLTELGFGNFPTFPSRVYGPVTAGVVKQFQQANSLVESGTANLITQQVMEEALAIAWKSGDRDPKIVTLKQQLTELGYGNFPRNPSTAFGPVTERVVRDFQSDQELRETGRLDRLTINKMNELSTIVIRNGDRSEEARLLKKQLTQLGFGNFPTSPTNAYGPVTMRVVNEFQQHFSIRQQEEVNKRMIQILERETNTQLQAGHSSEQAYVMKRMLTAAGYGNFPTDPSTVYGSVTTSVVSEFQASQDLPVSGIMDSVSLERLRELQ